MKAKSRKQKKTKSNYRFVIIGVLIVIIVAAILIGTKGFGNKVANVYSSIQKNIFRISSSGLALCLRDANHDGIMDVKNPKEFYLSPINKCLRAKGSPGIPAEKKKPPYSFFEINEAVASVFLAASPTPTQTPYQSPSATASVSSSPSPSSSVSPSLSPKPTSVSTPTSSVSPVASPKATNLIKANVVEGLFTPELRRKITQDRKKAGLDKREYKDGEFNCVDFANALEKTDPEFYTITGFSCGGTYECINEEGDMITHSFSVEHVVDDMHLANGKTEYVDPQTGTKVPLEDVGINPRFSEAMSRSPYLPELVGCKKPMNAMVLCDKESFEDAKAAQTARPSWFHDGFKL